MYAHLLYYKIKLINSAKIMNYRENLEEHIFPNQLFDLLKKKRIFSTINTAFNMIVWLKYFLLKEKK
jgi:hypothetical protein